MKLTGSKTVHSQTFTYENATGGILRLIVEPLARHYLIQSGERVDVVCQGGDPEDPNTKFEFEQTADGGTIYGWPRGAISVLKDGVELPPSPQN